MKSDSSNDITLYTKYVCNHHMLRYNQKTKFLVFVCLSVAMVAGLSSGTYFSSATAQNMTSIEPDRLPGRLSFLHQLQSPLHRHITVLPQKLHPNIRPHLQSATGFCMEVFDTQLQLQLRSRVGTRAPFSTSMTYGLRSQMSCVALVMSICAPNF